jgi:hypothetical protein
MKRLFRATMYIAAAPALVLSTYAYARAQDLVHPADRRLLAAAEKIQGANAALCARQAPALGVALQSRDQFPPGGHPGFAAEVAFAAILPGSPAALAGIAEGDGLVAIAGEPVVPRPGFERSKLRDSAYAMLGEHRPGTPLVLTVVSGGVERTVELMPPSQCFALVEVLVGGGRTARAGDGWIIQIGLDLMQRASDDEVAAIFAHELSHVALGHRERLTREGARSGLGRELGRSRQLGADAEMEADRLSVHLLANAGFDPRIVAALWRGPLGRTLDAGIFRSRIYRSPEQRAQVAEREIADYLGGGAPSWPGHLLGRR